ncbi:MAG: GrpB family protein [Chloroflexi bacterium]|nr:GrpB family protein [Chloroflexota bacterium]MCI0649574.1 GrpB family protein [Chloroflexota bacterium]MCI0729350.1 GrpB family protein [Chloroflexota bacterium]
MPEPIAVVSYDPEWPVRFMELARPLRQALGDSATFVPNCGGLAG